MSKNINKSHSSLDGETGRSMVEMLGVLAIIGVLSVGGIAGYTMAMNKHKANELLNEASKRAVVVSGHLLSGKEGSITEFTDPSGYQFGYATVEGQNQFKLTLKTSAGVKIDESICAQIKNVVGGEHTNPSVNDDCTELTYNNDLGDGSASAGSTELPSCECDEEQNGPCVQYNGSCVPKFYRGTRDTWNNLKSMTKESERCPNGGVWATMDILAVVLKCPTTVGDDCTIWPSNEALSGWTATKASDPSLAFCVGTFGTVRKFACDGSEDGPDYALCVR